MGAFGGDGAGLSMELDLNGIPGFDASMAPQAVSAPAPQGQQQQQLHHVSQQGDLQQSFQSQQQGAEETTEPAVPGSQISNNISSGIGAGPLPAGFGQQPGGPNGGSTLTEFTKRRNWAQRTIEEIKDFLHILDHNGRIAYVSASAKTLTGYDSDELVGKIFKDFLHPDDYALWVLEFHGAIASAQKVRFYFRFLKKDRSYAIFETHGHPHIASPTSAFGVSNPTVSCSGFFMMSRPYPSKNATLLDSLLEHKIENERLTKRIADLRKEEQEELEQQNQQWEKSKQTARPTMSEARSEETMQTTTSGHSTDYNLMPPPSKPALSNLQLTQQNLDEANASSKPDSINDKMARYEGATHIETIEMLTGLRYRDGERSKGISTGDASPSLIRGERGDAGIAMPVDRDGRGGDKKKKLKLADEYVCTDCGTLDSPEWRKGPSGPKTLCNACGLRWAKKEKKRAGPPGPSPQTPSASLSKENSQGSN